MRVVVLASYAPSLTRFRGRLIADMIHAGHQVIACAPGAAPDVAADLTALGARYVPVLLSNTGINPLADLRTIIHLTRLLRQLEPDLLLAYTQKPVIYGSIAARLAGVPRIFAMVTGLGYAFTEVAGIKRRLLRRVSQYLLRLGLISVQGVIFQNPDDLADFRRMGIISNGHNTVVVDGSGVDTAHYAHVVPRIWPPVFLLISRLLRDKGIVDFVEAARLVRARHPEATFQLVGFIDSNPSAISAAELERWVEENVIEYLGETADVRPYLAACSVFVLPSYLREGVPRTILEAMATGRAIITTDVPGCRETVIEGLNGFLVKTCDPGALAAAMTHFVTEPELSARMGRESRTIAETRFEVGRVNRILLEAMELA